MDKQALTFGEFIIQKRKEKDLSARQLAFKLNLSPVYICDMEKGRKASISKEFLDGLRQVLNLSEEDSDLMYDLVARARNTVSADLPEYIMENELVRTALRTAKKNQIPDEKWERFIQGIIKQDESGE